MKIKPPSSDEEEPAGELDRSSSLAVGKRMRTEWLETQEDEEEEMRPHTRLAVEGGSSSLEGWEFGRLPRLQVHIPLPIGLPYHLGELLRVPPALLKQLSTVKIQILAKAFNKANPRDGYNHSENTLCEFIERAIRTMVPGWEPKPAPLPNLPESAGSVFLVDRESEVAAAVAHWLKGWTAGERGRAVNLFCHSSGMGKSALLQALGNPPGSLKDCPWHEKVHLKKMPVGSQSLDNALTAALLWSARLLRGIRLGPLKRLQASATVSFDSMLSAIQDQLEGPLIVAFDQLEEIYAPKREVMFAAQLEGCSESPDHKLLRMAELFMAAVQTPLMTSPHLFYVAASQAVGPALMGKSLLPGDPSSCQTQVIVLKGISVPGIKTLLRNTIWQGDRIHRGEPLCVRLGLQPDTKEWDLFSNDVHSLTGGVPALVVPALTSCVTHRPQGGWGRLAHDKLREMLSPKVDWLTPWEAVVAASPQQGTVCPAAGSGGQAGPAAPPQTPETPQTPIAAQAQVSSGMASPGDVAVTVTPSSGGGVSTDLSTPSTDGRHDPGLTIMRRAKSERGVIAACLTRDAVAVRSFNTEHSMPLVLAHFLGLPLKIPETAQSLEDMVQLFRMTMAASSFAAAGEEGMIQLVMPMVAVLQWPEGLGSALLPVLTAHLMEFLRTNPLFVNTWKVLEWLWRDVVLKILLEILTKPSSERSRLKGQMLSISSGLDCTALFCTALRIEVSGTANDSKRPASVEACTCPSGILHAALPYNCTANPSLLQVDNLAKALSPAGAEASQWQRELLLQNGDG
ncbi:g4354 [Coccomyxa viridis]|uniref:G4354 protein n=1 Tax=Coccomyxa viridis TaxID=1274662 RepID=A0ABP1FQ39_9CHLO